MGTFGGSRRFGRDGGGPCRRSGGPVRPVYETESLFHAKPDYKTEALCKLVRRVLGMTLSGECADPVLQGLIVDEVHPAPNAGRLLVRVVLRAAEDGPTVADVLVRLEKVRGLLRMRIAEASARKRTPELAFEVVPYGLPAEREVDNG